MTYQRNMRSPCLLLEVDEPVDEVGEDLVEAVQVGADDHAGGDDDHRRLQRLLTVGEVDLRQLAADLAAEADDAPEAAGALDRLAAGLALRLAGEGRGDGASARRRAISARG